MKLNTSDFGRKCQFPLMFALGVLPLLALIVLQSVPSALPALPWFLAAYVLLAWLCIVLPGKIRVAAGALSCAALMLLGLRLLPIVSSVSTVDSHTISLAAGAFLLLVPLLLCALLMHGLRIAAWPREQEPAFNWFAVGTLCHLLAQFVSYVKRQTGFPEWESARQTLLVSFIGFLLLVMLSLNRSAMQSAAQGRQRVPSVMRRRNTVFTVGILAAAVAVAAIPAIANTLRALWRFTLRIIRSAAAFLAALLPQQQAPSGGMGGSSENMYGMIAASKPSLLAVILERVVLTLALLFAAAILLWALRIAIRKLAALLRLLAARLGLYAASASQDYVDEISDTREGGGETEGTLLERLRRRLPYVNERKLPPAERIRHRYKLLLRRHPDWHQSSTARENLAADAAELYERARYSGRDVSAEQADCFLKGTHQ